MGFGYNLADILASRQISVYKLSKETGIPTTTIHAIIKRDSNNVNLEALTKISDYLDMTLDDLVGYDTSKSVEENLKTSPLTASILSDITSKFNDKILEVSFSIKDYSPDELLKIVEYAEFIVSLRKEQPLSKTRKYTKEEITKHIDIEELVTYILNAIHKRTNIDTTVNVTDEMEKHDHDIMDENN